jgi:long-subunit fatty acid transport protein
MKRGFRRPLFLALVIVVLQAFASGLVLAAGFAITLKSVKGLGNAFAGAAAVAEDAGTIYQFSDRLGFDLSYTYITMVDDAEIDKTATGKDTFRGDLKGDYDGSGNIVGLQISYKF